MPLRVYLIAYSGARSRTHFIIPPHLLNISSTQLVQSRVTLRLKLHRRTGGNLDQNAIKISGNLGAGILMIAVIDKIPVSFDEFIDWYPENSQSQYELRRGVIIEMPKPRGKHSRLAGDLAFTLGTVIRQANQPYFIPKECVVKIASDTGYEPDIIVLDETAIANESRWERESIITKSQSIKLVVEVVSTNWRDDYLVKLADYEEFGIQEYWIADYLGIGGRRYIGSPKQPTFTVCSLVDGEYEIQQFRGSDSVISVTFPEFPLTVDEIFNPG
ncbi:MAG: Uma2 family endonuclease [Gloeotrichia echinulata GP01]